MPDPKYAFMSAYLKGEEAHIVTLEHIERISAAANIQDAVETIRDTDIGNYFEELTIETFDDLDEYLWSYFAQRIDCIESFRLLPKDMRKILETYIVKYDVLNIKAALQSIPNGKKARMIPMGVIRNHGLLDNLCSAEKLDDISALLIKCKLEDYVPALEKYETSGEPKARLLAETELDNRYYGKMQNMTRSIKDGSVLARAIGLAIDLMNLQIISRAIIEDVGLDAAECIVSGGYMISKETAREMLSLKLVDMPQRLENTQYRNVSEEILSSYDKTKNITAVEEAIDKHKFRLLKEMLSPRILSPLVMAWYLILKEVEIRNLRLILKAISDGVPTGEVKDYLVL